MRKIVLVKMKNKKGQEVMGMPYSTIFSILLIILFLSLGFYVIYKFVVIKKCGETALFSNSLQEKVNLAWQTTTEYSSPYSDSLPKEIKEICFVNTTRNAIPSSTANTEKLNGLKRYASSRKSMVFNPPEKACENGKSFEMKNIDIGKMTEAENPYCIPVSSSGKINLVVEKMYGEKRVILRRGI